MRRILITGSRDWTDEEAIRRALLTYAQPGDTVVHGGARGADQLAEICWRPYGPVKVHPANWQRWGRSAGPRRNADMVQAGADLCLAFPIGASAGTRSCMRLAEAAGIPVIDLGDAVSS